MDPSFILKGLALILAAALLLAYATLCILYYRGQWQLVLHPSRTVTQTPATLGLPFSEVHFGVDASGQPQLTGWWIPAVSPSSRTVLMLHSATGNIANAIPTAQLLHQASLNVFLFDYRGYGTSLGAYPSQATMQQDAHTALGYLTQTRQLPKSSLDIYGHDLGAALALQLCATSAGECPALILDAPDGDLLARAQTDTRSSLVPTSLLFRDRFPLADPLRDSPIPKLLITYGNNQPPAVLRNARNPKMTVELQPGDTTAYLNALQRFLDEHSPEN